MSGRKGNIVIENARILFRNFAGEKGKYGNKGTRSFNVILDDPALVEVLETDGWNVTYLKPREGEDEAPQPKLQVFVRFDNYPPNIYVITGSRKVQLDEETVGMLDYAEIETLDLIIAPYNWEVDGERGTKAYLKKMYVTLVVDELEAKYENTFNEDNGE